MHGELEAIAASIRTSFVIMLLQHSTIELCDNATKNQERPSRSESGVSVLVSNTQNKTGRRNERGSSDKSSWDEVRNSTGIIGALGTLVRMVSSQTAVCLFFPPSSTTVVVRSSCGRHPPQKKNQATRTHTP